jgi:hypothetical protein
MLTNVDIAIQAAGHGCQVGGKHTLPPLRPPTMGAAQAVKAATKGSAPKGSKSLDSPVLQSRLRAGWGVLRRERREKRQPLDGGPGGRAPLVGFQGQGPRVKACASWLKNSL